MHEEPCEPWGWFIMLNVEPEKALNRIKEWYLICVMEVLLWLLCGELIGAWESY